MATVGVHGICIYHDRTRTVYKQCAVWLIAYRRGLLRCSFYQTGQCEGLEVWDGQQVQTPALFSYVNNTHYFQTSRFWEPADTKETIQRDEKNVFENPVCGYLLCHYTCLRIGAVQRLGQRYERRPLSHIQCCTAQPGKAFLWPRCRIFFIGSGY